MKLSNLILPAGLMVLISLQASCGKKPLSLSEKNIDKIVAAMTREEKAHFVVGMGQKEVIDSTTQLEIAAREEMVPGCAGFTYPIPRLGIPAIVFADGPAGPRISPVRKGSDDTFYCTGWPVGILLSSTWDPETVRLAGRGIGNETLEYGIDVILAPGVNIMRSPLCGRNFEYYSEDPLLTGRIAAAYVDGVQEAGVGTSIKHFAVNNQELNRLSNDSRVTPRAVREIYLKGFEIAVKESQPWTLMSSYNYLNGVYTSESSDLLTCILRDEWGYEGAVITDWGGGNDAAAQIRAGNNFIAPGTDAAYRQIIAALEDGSLDERDLDVSVKAVLKLIVKTPRFRGYVPSDKPDLAAHAADARKAAVEGMVLLKNDGGALPLKEGAVTALFGANSYKLLAGGTGAGDVNKAYTVNLDEGLTKAGFTLEEGLDAAYRSHVAAENERLAPLNEKRGWWFGDLLLDEMPEKVLDKQLALAVKNAGTAVVTIARQSGEGRDHLPEEGDFMLGKEEFSLLSKVSEAFHAAGKKVVVVLNTGAVLETASWKGLADAILLAWQPGQEAGYAIADILSGKVNPSGKLPVTFPESYASVPSQNFPLLRLPDAKNGSWWHHKKGMRWYDQKDIDYTDYLEDIYVGYRYYSTFGVGVSYPFGYGLSYTDFTYGEPSLKKVNGGWEVSVDVTNSGEAAGREIVELYSTPCFSGDYPTMELRTFAKTGLLAPGETETVVLKVGVDDLASYDEASHAMVTRAGGYVLSVARNVEDVCGKVEVSVDRDISREVNDVLHPRNADGSPSDRPLYIDGGEKISNGK